jgi:hypothetical protein
MQNNAAAIGRQMVGNHPDGLAGNARAVHGQDFSATL